MPALDALRARLAELNDLRLIGHLTGWDQRTMMPPGGGPERAEQLATLERLAHERARAEDDFAQFAPVLERNVALARAYADCFDGFASRYDALLADYDFGLTSAR